MHISSPHSQTCRVLYLEYDKGLASNLVYALESSGSGVTIQHMDDSEAVLHYLTHSGSYDAESSPAPDIVVVNLDLSRLDALEVLSFMNDDNALYSTPVVVIGQSEERAHISRVQSLGADAYVIKSDDISVTCHAVSNAIQYCFNSLQPDHNQSCIPIFNGSYGEIRSSATEIAQNEATDFITDGLQISILDGPHAGEILILEKSDVLIGRKEGCELQLDRDHTVSRMHAFIKFGVHELTLIDLNSANGTFVRINSESHQIQNSGIQLLPGDEIEVGGSSFRLNWIPAVQPPKSSRRA